MRRHAQVSVLTWCQDQLRLSGNEGPTRSSTPVLAPVFITITEPASMHGNGPATAPNARPKAGNYAGPGTVSRHKLQRTLDSMSSVLQREIENPRKQKAAEKRNKRLQRRQAHRAAGGRKVAATVHMVQEQQQAEANG
jgi:hypothetical protein